MKAAGGVAAGLVLGILSTLLFLRSRPDIVEAPRILEDAPDLKIFELPVFTFAADRKLALEARSWKAAAASDGISVLDPLAFAAERGRFESGWEDLGVRVVWPRTSEHSAAEGLRIRVQPLDPQQRLAKGGPAHRLYAEDVNVLIEVRTVEMDWDGGRRAMSRGQPIPLGLPGAGFLRYVRDPDRPLVEPGAFVRLGTVLTYSEGWFYATELKLAAR